MTKELEGFYQIEENINDYNFETNRYDTYELIHYRKVMAGPEDYSVLFTGTLEECEAKIEEFKLGLTVNN